MKRHPAPASPSVGHNLTRMREQKTVAFIGLGAMGWSIAARLAAAAVDEDTDVAYPVLVWNRTRSKAEEHEAKFGTRCAHTLSELSQADFVISCLPTSFEVAAVVEELVPLLNKGSVWIDCTSGDPDVTKELARKLGVDGVTLVDCPVSGGPAGAKSGQLTAMVGGDVNNCAKPIISLFAKKRIVDCGTVGAGHAVKAMNNCLNAVHLVVGGEALIALKRWGVSPEVALCAINASSGRSLQTEERIPKEVLSREFDYGFKLGLMYKDVCIAVENLGSSFDENSLLPLVKNMLKASVEEQGFDADYTRVVETLERKAGVQLCRDV